MLRKEVVRANVGQTRSKVRMLTVSGAVVSTSKPKCIKPTQRYLRIRMTPQEIVSLKAMAAECERGLEEFAADVLCGYIDAKTPGTSEEAPGVRIDHGRDR